MTSMSAETERCLDAIEAFAEANGWVWRPHTAYNGVPRHSNDMFTGIATKGEKRLYVVDGYAGRDVLHLWTTSEWRGSPSSTDWDDHGDFTDPLILLAKLYETIGGNDGTGS